MNDDVIYGGGTDDKGRDYTIEIIDLGYCLETVTKVESPDGRVDIYVDRESKD